ncbi:hypothetical protein L228DRAFT_260275 [Xylona heveae TC161]|uniref:CCCH zinc finger and RRM domain-containing protein n=1 Tax=Xylona heveae (strain CBS 132557 / TC161) TaxID=1328760 RepID=A0A165HFW0_XYLHT|nr:hypothetical protein L228DRAFT_260275 [Xylona heveae TC161]KZF23450.1 hypothetical protein L228DRAFT_260275 [Xylona heveae TC161]
MQFTDEEAVPLKKWVVKRLEDISDADSDVLADYVLALIRSDASEEEVRQASVESLEDFLKEHTASFVEDIFQSVNAKSFLPSHSPQPPQAYAPPTYPTAPAAPVHEGFSQHPVSSGANGKPDQSRKRPYNDRESAEPSDGRDLHYSRGGGERSTKQMRRGGGRGGRFDNSGSRNSWQGAPPSRDVPPQGLPGLIQTPNIGFQGMPQPPPGFPFDPSDPMTAILAMQAMGFPPLPGMSPFPTAGSPQGFGQSGQRSSGGGLPVKKVGQRCKDYDEKGYCGMGAMCPYEHGQEHIVVSSQSEEYDPHNSSIMTDIQSTSRNGHGGERGRGRGRGRNDRGGFASSRKGRSEYSIAGPNQDRSITTIVVEQIPEEQCNESTVRAFFSEFGNIQDITLQPYKRLAMVKYDDWASAKRAYDSPKVIFDNRFVKVYWFKPERHSTPTSASAKGDEPMIDLEEFGKKQAEVQKAHEEKMKRLKETEAAREELEKRREELLRNQQEEKKKLLERLAAKTGSKTPSASPGPTGEGASEERQTTDDKSGSQTEALRAQLAALEAEAKSLGLDTNLSEDSYSTRGRGRGRGVYRGRGGYIPRGRGYNPYSASYRGGWAGARGGRGGSSHKLDNRTKKVAVSGVEFDAAKDEGLRQYLLGVGEFEHIEHSPEKPNSQVITFKDRATAEKFLYTSSDIPGVGKVELSWVNTPLPPVSLPPKQPEQPSQDNDAQMGDGDATAADSARHADVDYDVADDDDRWMT